MSLRVLDLFSGVGGFSLGLERAGGFQTVAFCEIEPFQRSVLAKHWPEVKCYHDVRELSSQHLTADGIAVDVICGGFPCQDISIAGKGAGLAGERSGLWREFARLIGELRPQYVLVENVSALLARGLADVLGDLAALGYDAEWHCIPASAIGAPHRRDRVWIVAYPGCTERWSGHTYRIEDGGQHNHQPIRQEGAVRPAKCCSDVADTESQRRGEKGQFRHNESTQWAARSSETLADTAGARCGEGRSGSCGQIRDEARRIKPQRHGGLGGEVRQSGSARLEIGPGTIGEWAYAATTGTGWWATEPDVGGRVDGFPVWLDRCCEIGASYRDSNQAAAVLRCLWNAALSQALWRAAGGLERFQQAQTLFAFVREYEAGSHEARLLLAGKEVPDAFLRGLRLHAISGSAPYRPGQVEQPSVEHSDIVQSMSRLLARDSQADWSFGSWEDACPRVVTGSAAKVDRRKRLIALGNGVVPQIPELLGRAILAHAKRAL